MNLSNVKFLKQVEKFTIDNSSTILTGVGAVGTITTAYLTGKASFKAANTIRDAQFQINLHELKAHELTFQEKVKIAWTHYIPPTVAGITTVAAIIAANRISAKRAAAMAAAYAISENKLNEFKDKAAEKLGVKKTAELENEIAQEKVNTNPVGKNVVYITNGGDSLFYDSYSGRYFNSSMETVRKAENDVNFEVINNGWMSLNDFYERVGLSRARVGDEIGWTNDQHLTVSYETTLSDDDRPCIVLDYKVTSIR